MHVCFHMRVFSSHFVVAFFCSTFILSVFFCCENKIHFVVALLGEAIKKEWYIIFGSSLTSRYILLASYSYRCVCMLAEFLTLVHARVAQNLLLLHVFFGGSEEDDRKEKSKLVCPLLCTCLVTCEMVYLFISRVQMNWES